jgi:hypothetical protein
VLRVLRGAERSWLIKEKKKMGAGFAAAMVVLTRKTC